MADDDWDDDAAPVEFTGQRLTSVNASRPPKPFSSVGRGQVRDLQGSRPREGPRGRGQGTGRPNRNAELVFQIGKMDVGKLIGRGGSSIKELRDATGCQVLEISWRGYFI